jgi:hypothetical protein
MHDRDDAAVVDAVLAPAGPTPTAARPTVTPKYSGFGFEETPRTISPMLSANVPEVFRQSPCLIVKVLRYSRGGPVSSPAPLQ